MILRKHFIAMILRLTQLYHHRVGAAIWGLSDVYLVSYPKSGTTWLCLMLANVLNLVHSCRRRVDLFSVHDFVPDIHANPEIISTLAPPRIIKTHELASEWHARIRLKGKRIQSYPRVIYLVRDGRDAIASYFRYVRALHGYSRDLTAFLEGKGVKRPDWAEHVKSWLVDRPFLDDRQLLRIRYEDMIADPLAHLSNIVHFIGIEADQATLTSAIAASSLEPIRQLQDEFGDGVAYHDPEFRFAGRGTAGQWTADEGTALSEYFERHRSVFDLLGYEH